MDGKSQNWFDHGGEAYARHRPDYPRTLAKFLASIAPGWRLAIDVGCGNGQFTRQLAEHFQIVIGSDLSADQIEHALPHARVQYEVGPAEKLRVEDGSVSLITAAQAAHWFDLPVFYKEVRRVAAPGAIVALISYGVPQLEPDLNTRLQAFYHDEVGPYWPPTRKLVDGGYADIPFPFPAMSAPSFSIERTWSAKDLLGYISTWSAVRRGREAGQDTILAVFAEDLLKLWGDRERRRRVIWPINMRLGVVG